MGKGKLRKINDENLQESKESCNFAADLSLEYEEPTALATDSGKDFIISGEDAIRFEERMRQVEEEYYRRKNKKPTKEDLERKLKALKISLEFEKRRVENLENEIKEIEEKIQTFD